MSKQVLRVILVVGVLSVGIALWRSTLSDSASTADENGSTSAPADEEPLPRELAEDRAVALRPELTILLSKDYRGSLSGTVPPLREGDAQEQLNFSTPDPCNTLKFSAIRGAIVE